MTSSLIQHVLKSQNVPLQHELKCIDADDTR